MPRKNRKSTRTATISNDPDRWLCCSRNEAEQRSKYDEDDVRVGPLADDAFASQTDEKDIEEEEDVDLLLDSAIIDILGVHFDCSALKNSSLVRHYVKAATRSEIPWIQDMIPDIMQVRSDDNDKNAYVGLHRNNSSHEEDVWASLRHNMKTTQAPMRVTLELCHQIRLLPERDVTLYIRLDEEVPKDSCTAYEVDWERFCKYKEKCEEEEKEIYIEDDDGDQQQQQTSSDNDNTISDDNLFRCFRLCSREKRSFSRIECIVGTFASACLHPYTLILSGTTITTKSQRRFDQDGPPTREAPFRPRRLLLDRPEDVCTAELQFYLTRMGLTDVQEAPEELRELYDETDLDFFLDDPDETANDETELQLNDYDELVISDELPLFLAGNTVNEKQNEALGRVLAEGCTFDAMVNTSVPFICLDDE